MNLADIRSSQAGGKPRKRTGKEGRSLETLILASQTDVLLTKIPLSARRLPGGKVVACAGPVDFMGAFRDTREALIFDAKQSKNPSRLETNADKLKEHQRIMIVEYGISGICAGLLCECTATRELYWCFWGLLTYRKPSIPWEQMRCIGSSDKPVDWNAIRFHGTSAPMLGAYVTQAEVAAAFRREKRQK